VNRNKPQVYKDAGLMVNASNLCSEIMLPSTANESFICCLSSMNLELYDEWKDTNAVKLAIYFLDAVLSEFIEKTEGNYYLTSARNFAMRHRALGLGVLGYHSYLQKNMIPFESFRQLSSMQEHSVISKNKLKLLQRIGKHLRRAGYAERLRIEKYNLLAVAPTTSSSAILGQTSPELSLLLLTITKQVWQKETLCVRTNIWQNC
jgi:ribonucleoside-diphosphate reductase alpha chain